MSARGFIVSGTDTGVGKTIFAAGLARALGAEFWKPVQAGLDGETDSRVVARLTKGEVRIHAEAFRLATPCSPHEAARIDGCTIHLPDLSLPNTQAQLVIEGAGGVLVPHGHKLLSADIFAHWGLPTIVVARTALGTINHSLLSIEALRARGVAVAGIAFVGDEEPVAETAIVEIAHVPHLGRLPYLDPLTPKTLAKAFAENMRMCLIA